MPRTHTYLPGRHPLGAMLGALALAGCLGGPPVTLGDLSDPNADMPGAGDDMSVQSDVDPLGSEEFPPALTTPYTGAPSTYYDNTFITYPQLKNRVKAIFNDDWVRGTAPAVDMFQKNLGLLGGVDFTSHFLEARVATSDFLFVLDGLSKDVCAQAITAGSGPFSGLTLTGAITAANVATVNSNVDTIHKRMLFRSADATELTDAFTLLSDLVTLGSTPKDAYAGLCEALIRHPDFLFTLPPSYATRTGDEKKALLLVKVANDLVARPPTAAELTQVTSTTIEALIDTYLASTEFRDRFFYKMRLRTESDGTAEADEPARLWTYLAMNDQSFAQLFTGDFSVDASFGKVTRAAEHGPTGLLTMPGFIKNKPGLPHYNYSARVLGDYLGVVFDVPQAIQDMRLNSTAASTVDKSSACYSCHRTLTPLAMQRQKWDDDGVFRTMDASGALIDDSDQNVVAGYPWKGAGMGAFAAEASKSEAFIRQTCNALFLFLFNRTMRYGEDERVIYKALWDLHVSSGGNLRKMMKTIMMSPGYQP